MDEQLSQLLYPSIRPILQYSSIEKRQTLVKSIPSLRKVNRKVPYCFEKVVLVLNDKDHDDFYDEDDPKYKNEVVFELDQMKWTILREDDGRTKKLVTPKGNVLETESFIEDVQALARYYLFRENCTVKHMQLQNIQYSPNLLSFSRIGSLELTWTDESLRGTVGRSLTMFRDTRIGNMELMVEMMDETSWKHEVQNLQIADLLIETEDDTPDDLFDDLQFKKLKIHEEFTSVEKFSNMCLKFKNDQMEVGSCYTAWFRHDWNEFWNEVKEKLEVETSSMNFFTIPMDDPDCEILVKRCRTNVRNRCQMKVVKKEDRTWQAIRGYPNDWFSQQNFHWRAYFDNNIYNFLFFVLIFASIIFYIFHSQNILKSSSKDLKERALLGQVWIGTFTVISLIHYFSLTPSTMSRAGRAFFLIWILIEISFILVIPFAITEDSSNDKKNVVTVLDFSNELNRLIKQNPNISGENWKSIVPLVLKNLK